MPRRARAPRTHLHLDLGAKAAHEGGENGHVLGTSQMAMHRV